jgi:hypothetical protein
MVLAIGASALAQSMNATLSGIVKDTSAAVLPGVTVTVRNLGTNQTRHTQTDGHGRYAFPDLAIGGQEVVAALSGFQTSRAIVELTVGQNAALDIMLGVGGVTETVQVSGDSARLGVETRSSTYGTLVTRSQIESQPLNGRDFSQLIFLQPGAVQARSDQGDILTGKGAKISVHGARTTQNAYMLDGTDILDALGRSAASAQGLVSGIESVQEFTVLTNTFTAEYGRAAGGVFNIATRSGTNAFHGSGYEYHRNDALDAKNYFDCSLRNGATCRADLISSAPSWPGWAHGRPRRSATRPSWPARCSCGPPTSSTTSRRRSSASAWDCWAACPSRGCSTGRTSRRWTSRC